jgi:hypothetical protein
MGRGNRLGSVRFRCELDSGTERFQFSQTDIGKRIQKSLDSVIQKQSNNRDIAGDAALYFRLSPDRKVRVRALSSNNPKQFEGVKTYYALFQGTFDLESKKWMTTRVRSLPNKTTRFKAPTKTTSPRI